MGTIRTQLEKRKPDIHEGNLPGLMAFEKEKPVGMGWVDLPHRPYGSVLLYAARPEHRGPLAGAFADQGLLDETIIELTQFHPGEEYRQAFLRRGLVEKQRQKMGLGLEAFPDLPDLPPKVTLEPLSIEHAVIVGRISYAAHQVSKDLDGYPDFSSPEQRARLECEIFGGLFGEVIGPASLLVRLEGRPVGACLVVGLAGWGFPRVAWVLDMTIDPKYQGQGLGKQMLMHSLKGAAEDGVPVAGLAVTCDNTAARRLYEKMGFQALEQFYEYVGPAESAR